MKLLAHAGTAWVRASRSGGAILIPVVSVVLTCIAVVPARGADSGSAAQVAAPPSATASASFDCSGYQQLLNEYLVVTSAPGQPLETRFNYNGLEARKDQGVKLASIRQQLLNVAPSQMKDQERLAWAINAYNFLMIQAVTENMFEPIRAGQKGQQRFFYRNRHSTVQTMSIGGEKFFDAMVVEIEGRPYSLNTFERHFVFGDDDSAKRRSPAATLDPRAHFALVCAAKGCPALRPRCYRPDSIDQQLDVATREALASPTQLRWDKATGKLLVSSIFQWYPADFGGIEGAMAFIKRHVQPNVRTELEAAKLPWWSGHIPWDWSLNHSPVSGETPDLPKQ
jgi:hypothetical protein